MSKDKITKISGDIWLNPRHVVVIRQKGSFDKGYTEILLDNHERTNIVFADHCAEEIANRLNECE